MSKEFYSVKETAEILDFSRDRIYEYLRNGYLHGTRLTGHSAWRIPAAEIERLKGLSSGNSGIPAEDKSDKWSKYIDLALWFQDTLSNIGPKDWAICGLVDAVSSDRTSEAGVSLGVDGGKLVVKLSVESDKYFPLFMIKLKASFTGFESYDGWRKSLNALILICWNIVHEILDKSQAATGLSLSKYLPTGGKGHLTAVPRYIYEFALDNRQSGKHLALVVSERDPKHWILVPEGIPGYMLAMGSRDEMERCKEATTSLANQYAEDKRIGEIITKAKRLKNDAAPLQKALSEIIKQAAGDI